MATLSRRDLLGLAACAAVPAPVQKPRIGLVRSTHAKLARPSSPEDALDYERVRDMVWQAIDYAGGLDGRIRPGSRVVVKPNIVFLRPQPLFRPGDITDMRVTRAVVEYLARRTPAARITIAEGGSYRGVRDPASDSVVKQDGAPVDAAWFEWDPDEFPGFSGNMDTMLRDFARRFDRASFDYVDLNYDAVRDASGGFRRVEVPRTARGVGAFGARPDYFVTNTVRNADFLVSVPVMKVHAQCGITGCLKNYVGTAPREAYGGPGQFWNKRLHEQHEVDNRIDPFIVDLAAFHPPDFVVTDGIRGLQYAEHGNNRPDQVLRSNLVYATADPVAADALEAYLLGFNVGDIDFLHLARERDMGSMDLAGAGVAGDDPTSLRARWGKPRDWYGRCNREWLLSADPSAPMAGWTRHASRTDTLRFPRETGGAAAVRVVADGARKGFLWVGARGKVGVRLNGEKVMEEENFTRYRAGQFRQAVELRSGENLLVFEVASSRGPAQLSALLVGPRNDGDSLDGIRWKA